MKLPFTFLWVEFVFTCLATIFYIIAFIVLLAGFGWCAGANDCDARIAGGVSIYVILNIPTQQFQTNLG